MNFAMMHSFINLPVNLVQRLRWELVIGVGIALLLPTWTLMKETKAFLHQANAFPHGVKETFSSFCVGRMNPVICAASNTMASLGNMKLTFLNLSQSWLPF